jgi:hypothetical protein
VASVQGSPGRLDDVVTALMHHLCRPDLAAAVFALAAGTTAGGATAVWRLHNVCSELERHEIRYRMTHHDKRSACAVRVDNMTISVHDGHGDSIVRRATVDAFGPHPHLLFAADGHPPLATVDSVPAMVDRATFTARWRRFTLGLLDGWDWSNTVAAGGAVVYCLDPHVTDAMDRPHDVDLFFHTHTGCAETRQSVVKAWAGRLERFVRRTVGAGNYATLLTSRTMTLVFADPSLPRLQLALGLWSDAADVLTTADVDCCCVGFNGHDVFVTARGLVAWAFRVNTPSGLQNATRGSPTYELRLWKYASRHGFAVLDKEHFADSAAVRNARAAILTRHSLPRVQRRRVATTIRGLYWLLLVDAGGFSPITPDDHLLVTASCPLADVLRRVSAKGYVESDNYGSHEEGYVIVGEGEEAHALDDVDQLMDAEDIDRSLTMSVDAVPRSLLEQALIVSDHDTPSACKRFVDVWTSVTKGQLKADERDPDDDDGM